MQALLLDKVSVGVITDGPVLSPAGLDKVESFCSFTFIKVLRLLGSYGKVGVEGGTGRACKPSPLFMLAKSCIIFSKFGVSGLLLFSRFAVENPDEARVEGLFKKGNPFMRGDCKRGDICGVNLDGPDKSRFGENIGDGSFSGLCGSGKWGKSTRKDARLVISTGGNAFLNME